jgi:Cytochrome C'
MRTIAPALLLAVSACASAKFTPVADIPKLTTLEDVMDNQMGAADPQFAKIGAATLADADFAGFAQASERLLVTSGKIKDFSKDFPKGPAEFEALAAKLNEKAKALGAAAAAKDAAAAKAALTEMKATCKECHSKFR